MLGMHPLNWLGHRLDSRCPFLFFIHFPLQSLFVKEPGVVRQPRRSDIHFPCLSKKKKKHSYEYSGHSANLKEGGKMEGSKDNKGERDRNLALFLF